MTKDQIFTIAMNLSNIAAIVDDATYEKIKPYLKEIEHTVAEIVKESKERMIERG